MLRFSQYLKENKEPQSPLHKKFLEAGYTHKWTARPGDSRGDSKAFNHAYHHPDELETHSTEIKNKLDKLLPGYEYWKNNRAKFDKDTKKNKTIDMHNYFKGRTGDTIETEPNDREGGHYLIHHYDHSKG